MKADELMMLLGDTDDSLVAEGEKQGKRKKRWVGWAAAAACLCLIAVGAFMLRDNSGVDTVYSKDASPGTTSAVDYFRNCGGGEDGTVSSSACLDASAIPYAMTRSFSDLRSELEADGAIPAIDTHPQFTLQARYNEDGSLYCLELLWCRRSIGGTKNYSDLKVIAGHEEVPVIRDCISIELDENGNAVEPSVTVTERDGVSIVGRGGKNTEKSLTFQRESGWYQISGSWNDSYESVAELLDWFWEHPLDFDRYSLEAGDNYTDSTLSETPDAFREILPDFAAFGFVEESSYVTLKNGTPVRFEGHYVAHADEDKVKRQEYYDEPGYTTMHWCVFAEPDVYDMDGCLGDIGTLTRDQIVRILPCEDNKLKFTQDGLLIIVYPDSPAEVWELIESLQSR